MSASCQFDVSAPLRPLGCNSEKILCLKLATVFYDHNMPCRLPEVSPASHSSSGTAASVLLHLPGVSGRTFR